jgi:tetraacyldisaccharide 4'-kinase
MRFVLLPLIWIYQLILLLRHALYDWGLISSTRFQIPVICVGNLAMGGTGKTPHIEYLIRLLKNDYKTAVLSRGYGRSTSGFLLAKGSMTYREIGDEPMQYYKKFEDIIVAVDENRVRGVHSLLELAAPPQIVLLDDAFQHRAIDPGLNILLTDFHNLYPNDFLFPAGQLRDITAAAKRADIIIVTKTPKVFSPFTRRRLTEIIQPKPDQKLYFSFLNYGRMIPVGEAAKVAVPRRISTILMFCGIANPYPFQEFLQKKCTELVTIDFPDHHTFRKKDMYRIVNEYENILGKNKIIVTTEKDAMRLIDSPYFSLFKNIPLFYVPVEVKFHEEEQQSFDQQLKEYVRTTAADR